MIEVREVAGAELDGWDEVVEALPGAHLLQGRGWGELRAAQGWRVLRLLAVDRAADAPVGAAQALVRRRRGGAVAYVPRGPACAPGSAAFPALLAALEQRLRDRTVALRLEPHWPDEPAARRALEGAGLREAPALQPRSTLRLDLAAGEEALLAGMKSKWRYNARLAERKDVVVEAVGAAELDAALDDFEAMLHETASRQGFPARPAGYHAAAARALGPRATLYAARHEGRALAMILVARFADTATYLYGASRDLERQRMPNHALQWRAIRDAAAAGLRWYDLWGVPDALGRAAARGEDPDAVPEGEGGLWGVWRFKRGFGGELWRAVGARDAVHAPLRWWLGARALPAARAFVGRRG